MSDGMESDCANPGAVALSRRCTLRTGMDVLVALLVGGCGEGGSSASTASVPSASPAPSLVPTPTPTPAPTGPLSGVIVQAGDSIGYGTAAAGYAAIEHLDLGPGVAIHNVSVGGRTMVTGYQNGDAELFVFAVPSTPLVLVLEQGTNDLALLDITGPQLYVLLTDFVAAARRAGFHVAVVTLLPRSDPLWSPAREAERIAYNGLIRANAAGVDLILDNAADPVLGDAIDTATSPYYADRLHPNLLGQQRLAPLYAPALTSLLRRIAALT